MAFIALDAGHGSNTFDRTGGKGVIRGGKKYEEHDFNADVTAQVKKIVEDHGVNVLLTQPLYKSERSLEYRTNLANVKGVDLFVSIHANAGVPDASGACVFAWEGFERTNEAADLVVKHFKEAGIDLHGSGRHYSKYDSWTNFHVLRETDMHAILIESGFMTNDRDFENIFGKNYKEYRKKVAIAIAKGILEWYGIEYKAEDRERVEVVTGYYPEGSQAVKELEDFLTKRGWDYEIVPALEEGKVNVVTGYYWSGSDALKELESFLQGRSWYKRTAKWKDK